MCAPMPPTVLTAMMSMVVVATNSAGTAYVLQMGDIQRYMVRCLCGCVCVRVKLCGSMCLSVRVQDFRELPPKVRHELRDHYRTE